MADFHKYVVSQSKTGGKFWEVEVDGTSVRIRYGKVGQDKAWTLKEFSTKEQALNEAHKQFRTKLNKGYSEEELEAWDLSARLTAMEQALREHDKVVLEQFERREPVSDELIAQLEERQGYAFDPQFLEFFKLTNGLRVRWKWTHGGRTHAMDIPGLSSFSPPTYQDCLCRPGEYNGRMLGGWDLYEFVKSTTDVDEFDSADPPFYVVVAVINEKFPDPPAMMVSDYKASWGDYHPVLFRHYVAWTIATVGLYDARFWLFQNRGFEGNHELFIPRDNWLHGFPAAGEVLAYESGYGAKNPKGGSFVMTSQRKSALYEYFQSFFKQRVPVEKTPYAHYNQSRST